MTLTPAQIEFLVAAIREAIERLQAKSLEAEEAPTINNLRVAEFILGLD